MAPAWPVSFSHPSGAPFGSLPLPTWYRRESIGWRSNGHSSSPTARKRSRASPLTTNAVARSRCFRSLPRSSHSACLHRNLDKAAAKPLDAQRLPGVRDRFVADVLARAVIDLSPGRLDDTEHRDQAAARLEPAAGQAPALEVKLLAPARHQ